MGRLTCLLVFLAIQQICVAFRANTAGLSKLGAWDRKVAAMAQPPSWDHGILPFALCCRTSQLGSPHLLLYIGDPCTGFPLEKLPTCPAGHRPADDASRCNKMKLWEIREWEQRFEVATDTTINHDCDAPQSLCCKYSPPTDSSEVDEATSMGMDFQFFATVYNHDICSNIRHPLSQCPQDNSVLASRPECASDRHPMVINLKQEKDYQLTRCTSWIPPIYGVVCCQKDNSQAEFMLFFNGDACTGRLQQPYLTQCPGTSGFNWLVALQVCLPSGANDEDILASGSVSSVNVNANKCPKDSQGAHCCQYSTDTGKFHVWVLDYNFCSMAMAPVNFCPTSATLETGVVVQLQTQVGWRTACSQSSPRINIRGDIKLQLAECVQNASTEALRLARLVVPFAVCCAMDSSDYVNRLFYDGDSCTGTPLRQLDNCPATAHHKASDSKCLGVSSLTNINNKDDCTAPPVAKCCKVYNSDKKTKSYSWVYDYNVCHNAYVNHESCETLSVKFGKPGLFIRPISFSCSSNDFRFNIDSRSYPTTESFKLEMLQTISEVQLLNCHNWSPLSFAVCCMKSAGRNQVPEQGLFYDGDPCTGSIRSRLTTCGHPAFRAYNTACNDDGWLSLPLTNINDKATCMQKTAGAVCCKIKDPDLPKGSSEKVWVYDFDVCQNKRTDLRNCPLFIQEGDSMVALGSPKHSQCVQSARSINVRGKAEEQLRSCRSNIHNQTF